MANGIIAPPRSIASGCACIWMAGNRPLNRPGPITAGGTAPGCIGSSSGGECFQGAMDDLRIYGDALTGAEVMSLYHGGQVGLERYAREQEARLAAVYAPGASLSKLSPSTRQKLRRTPAALCSRVGGRGSCPRQATPCPGL